MGYPVLMHHLETFEYLLGNISNGSLWERGVDVFGKVPFLEVFHSNI